MENFAIQLTQKNKIKVKNWFINNTKNGKDFVFDSYSFFYCYKKELLNGECFVEPSKEQIIRENYKIINSISEIPKFKKKSEKKKAVKIKIKTEYPKHMHVYDESDQKELGEERLVLGKFNQFFIAVIKEDEDNYKKGKEYMVEAWRWAEEIKEIKEFSIEEAIKEITDKYNVNPEQIIIKK
jgi:hypothetical protein